MLTEQELEEQEEWQAETRAIVKYAPWLQVTQWLKDYEDRYGPWKTDDISEWLYGKIDDNAITLRKVNQSPVSEGFIYPTTHILSCDWVSVIYDMVESWGWIESKGRKKFGLSEEAIDTLGYADCWMLANYVDAEALEIRGIHVSKYALQILSDEIRFNKFNKDIYTDDWCNELGFNPEGYEHQFLDW